MFNKNLINDLKFKLDCLYTLENEVLEDFRKVVLGKEVRYIEYDTDNKKCFKQGTITSVYDASNYGIIVVVNGICMSIDIIDTPDII